MTEGPLEALIRQISALPGLGNRSARRVALHLLSAKDTRLYPLIHVLEDAAASIVHCSSCHALDSSDPCRICRDPHREKEILCVVATVADLWALERTRVYKGQYHVLGGVLSTMDGTGPESLSFSLLLDRLKTGGCKEIVLALPATVEGQATAHYLLDLIEGIDSSFAFRITKLAHGLPVGGALEYLDDSTIATALKSRGVV